MRKPDICLGENTGADQLPSQFLHGKYNSSQYFLNPKFSGLLPSSATVQTGLCQTWSKIPKSGFLSWRLSFVLPGMFIIADQNNGDSSQYHSKRTSHYSNDDTLKITKPKHLKIHIKNKNLKES